MAVFQNDFCSPEVCGDGPVASTRNAEAAQRASAFAAHAAGLGAQVACTQQIPGMGHRTARQRRRERPGGRCAAGTRGAGLLAGPRPRNPSARPARWNTGPAITGPMEH
jgi:hypothetical protein